MIENIIEENGKKQGLIDSRPLVFVDMYFYTYFQGRATLASRTDSSRSYFFQMLVKGMENVYVFFQAQATKELLKFRFKPTQFVTFNAQLAITSPRAAVDLRNHLQFLNRDQKLSRYKWYLDQNGYMAVELNCSLAQFSQLHHVSYILNTILSQVSDLFRHIIPEILSYINLETILPSLAANSYDSQTQETPTIVEKFKYMAFLSKVYKSHRQLKLSQKTQQYNQKLLPRTQTFNKTNNLIQSDTKYLEQLDRQKPDFQTKFKSILQLILPKIRDSSDYLKMPKVRKVQDQFEKYVASIRRDHLQIDDTKNKEYRILKGIQNCQVIKPPRTLSKNGAHSIILLGRYKLHLSDTQFNYQHLDIHQEQNESRHIEESLISKRINNRDHEPSVNSFRNEIDFLMHVKDKRSKFIATYFLPVEKDKADVEEIFSRHYNFNLREYLQSKRNSAKLELSLKEVLNIAENILFALIFLVQNYVLHRDLKPQNVVIDEDQKARLIDFGSCSPIIYCNEFEVKSDKLLTTKEYQIKYKDCPDQIKAKYTKDEYSRHYMYDIHSFGQTFSEMVEYLKVDSMKPIKGIQIQHIVQTIVSQCKDKDPMERITYDELLFYIKLLKELIGSP